MSLFRVTPALPAHAYKTYGMARPLATHWQPATCEDVDCEAFLNGWVTLIDEASELGGSQAHYIRRSSKRKFREERTPEGLTCFTFPAGQSCFRSTEHKQPVGRPPRFYVRDGDWRTPGRPVQFWKPQDWVEDFAEHQARLKETIERG